MQTAFSFGVREGEMASSRMALQHILCQLTKVGGITHRPMHGEYVLYCRGKRFGGIYGDRLFIVPTPAAERYLPDAPRKIPCAGVREMLLVERTDDPSALQRLIEAMLPELPDSSQ